MLAGDSLFIAMQYINVTLELLNKFSSSKRMKEILAVAIWMKMLHSNSVIWGLTSYRLRRELRIGKTKAGKLIKLMRETDLFAVDGNMVKVSSFRDKTVKLTKKGQAYRGAMVCRFEVREYSLRELYNLINEKLFEFQVCAAGHKDCLKGSKKTKNVGAKCHAITTMQFKRALNMGVGSVCRIKKRLVSGQKINSTYAEKHSFDMRNEEERNRTLLRTGKTKEDFTIGDLGFVVLPCSYSLQDAGVAESFKHLIYGKHKSAARQRRVVNVGGLPDGFFA